MKNLSGKNVALTGAGSGIGRALAMALSKEGCNLSISDISADRLEAVAEECRQIQPQINISTQVFDVSDEAAMHEWAKSSISHHGHIDIMINNAGVALHGVNAESVAKADFDWIMGINFWGMVYGTQAYVPHLKSRPESAILNVSSILGIVGLARQAPYCTTKFAIRGYTESLRMETLEEAPHLTVHSIHPGGVSTNIANDAKHAVNQKQAIDPEEANKALIMPPPKAAQIIIDHIKKKKSRIIIGNDAKKMQWIQRIWPERYTNMLLKQYSSLIKEDQ